MAQPIKHKLISGLFYLYSTRFYEDFDVDGVLRELVACAFVHVRVCVHACLGGHMCVGSGAFGHVRVRLCMRVCMCVWVGTCVWGAM